MPQFTFFEYTVWMGDGPSNSLSTPSRPPFFGHFFCGCYPATITGPPFFFHHHNPAFGYPSINLFLDQECVRGDEGWGMSAIPFVSGWHFKWEGNLSSRGDPANIFSGQQLLALNRPRNVRWNRVWPRLAKLGWAKKKGCKTVENGVFDSLQFVIWN